MSWVKPEIAKRESGLSTRTLKKYVLSGHIVANRLPSGRWMFDLESIQAFLRPAPSKRAMEILRGLR